MVIGRGGIYWADLGPPSGSRPAIAIQRLIATIGTSVFEEPVWSAYGLSRRVGQWRSEVRRVSGEAVSVE